ncbi:MAG: prolyl oligopeptidase family serine peptidase [Hyphomonadaceae bacterium]|nr:prolyl oligopeptidase family serine peptidase [Hyphomonadaceae bacterium]
MVKLFAVFGFIAVFNLPCLAQSQPPIEAYGELPEIRYAAISDSGTKVAMVLEAGGETRVAVYDLMGGEPKAIGTGDVQIRGLDFASDDLVILKTSETTRTRGYLGRFEYSGAFSLNLETMDVQLLLKGGTSGLWDAQGGLGRIIGHSASSREVFMPGWWANNLYADPEYHVFRVDLDTGRGRVLLRGRTDTRGWIVSDEGEMIARADYSNDKDQYRIYAKVDGKTKLIYEQSNMKRPLVSLVGVMPDNSGLVISGSDIPVQTLKFDGEISGPLLTKRDAEIDRIYMDANRVVHGARYAGAYPSYEFLDPELDADITAIVDASPNSTVNLIDWSSDWQKLLLKIEGDSTSGMYVYYDRETGKTTRLGDARPDVPSDAVGPVLAFSYAARDGLSIPTILTFPPATDIASVEALPLIALPHGGPESYDAAGFDWMAQYFANRGYLVLQPNFRGSSGYGSDFVKAGNGEWGRKMQDDITDGVNMLIAEGLADPERVCIVGASYGGYAALAGGAFTPDLYKCVVAIAPVSDLAMMMSDERESLGRNHWVVDYWEERMADGDARTRKLNAISPAIYASAFKAPVLLIHGEDDTVVPMRQSVRMHNALKRANRQVELIKLQGEDHWLSESPTRLATLQAVSGFVDEHIGDQ